MSLRLFRSEAAEADLDEIWAHVAADSPLAAERLIHSFEAAELRLADFPELAPARDGLRPGLRMWPVGNDLILYRIAPDAVEVMRILHGARDLGEALDEP